MGLDIALGLMILVGAIRGWFRGFVLQAIRLGGLVGCVYAAGPVRDLVRPHVAGYLASIRPDLLDRMLWWASAVASYVVTVGLAGLVVKLQRRRPYGEPEPDRADQFAGFLLATARGAVMAAFLVGALDKHALSWMKRVPWADEQARTSMALTWNTQYRPAERIWSAPPVVQFVAKVRQMGIEIPPEGPGLDKLDPAQPRAQARAQVAEGRTPRLDLPGMPPLDPSSPDFARNVDRTMELLEAARPALNGADPR